MQEGMSALLLKADMCSALAYVCFGPKADMRRAQQLSLISGRMMVARRRPRWSPALLLARAKVGARSRETPHARLCQL